MNYLYETHLHTSESSACGKMPAAEYIEYMKSKGYSGIVVTDHFFNGNSAVPRNLPWEERIERYCKGYENAKAAAEGTDFSVFFGVEFCYDGDEFLLYGIDKEWLLARPDILSYSRHQLFEEVSKAGGLMIHAHPYRERYYITDIHLSPESCHGIEVYNSGNQSYQNALAYEYGKKYHLPMTAGSDIHARNEKPMGGVRVSRPLADIQDFIQAFKNGEMEAVYIYPEGNVVPVTEIDSETVISQLQTCPIQFHNRDE